MKRRKVSPDAAVSGFNLIEEATGLLRSTSRATLALYYVGAIPFVMAFLYFWTDMSQSPFASRHSSAAAFGVALSFIWMKFWQGLFCARLRARNGMHPARQWSWRESLQVLLSQTMLHSIGLFLVPLAVVLIIPVAWVYAYFQNITVLADPDLSGSRLRRTAWTQAALWPGANHTVLGVLLLFGVFVLLNWVSLFVFVPTLIKMVLGIETAFTRSPGAMFNSTSLMAAVWMTYLSVDPLVKAAYVLRCFYGEARRSGEDLKTKLRQAVVPARAFVLILVVLIGLSSSATVTRAQSQEGSPADRAAIDPALLDEKIDTVIRQSRYTWRMPRTVSPEAEAGLLQRFIMSTARYFRDIVRTVNEWIDAIWDWLFGRRDGQAGSSGFDRLSKALPYLLLLLIAGVLGAILLRLRQRRKEPAPVTAEALPAIPDISNENVGADQLPEDGWTTLGRQLLERGEYRLAIRAFYLATLAHLAQRNLVGIARFKSNRDYETELRRRAHALPGMLSLFSENLFVFERTWYGMHEVDRDLVQEFAATVDRIRREA